MRFMILLKSDKNTEAGVMPTQQLLEAMTRYNEELVQAGVMQSGEGLQATARGAKVKFHGDERSIVNGPFSEPNTVAGFWIFKTESLEAAIDWVKRCPSPLEGEAEIEIRQIFETEDFGAELTPELRAQEQRLRGQLQNNTH